MAKPVIRCSELGQLLWCPGSRVLRSIARPRDGDSLQARAGSWCHAEAAKRLIAEEGAIGPADGIRTPAFEPTAFHRFIVDYYLDTVRNWVESYMAIEVECEMEWEFDRFILTGHHDLWAISADGREGFGADLKAGADPVTEAEDNSQVLGYQVLEALNYPDLVKDTFLLCQPQNNPDDGLNRITLSGPFEGREKLMALASYLEREVNHALDHPHLLNSDGYRQCHYCPAALVCPAYFGDIQAMKIELTPEMIAAIPSEPDVERLWQLEQARKKFATPLDAAHEQLKTTVAAEPDRMIELQDGTKLYIVDRPGRRTIEFGDNEKVTQALNDLPDALFHRTYAFRPAEIEEVLAEAFQLPKTSKKGPSGQKLYKQRLEAFTKQDTVEVLKAS